ncbi:uncharacterized protein J5F26_007951 [Ciconia maguari]
MVVETRGVQQLTGHHSADTTLRPCNTEGQSWQTLRRAQDAALTHQCWIRAGQGCPSLPCIPAAGRAPLFNAPPPLEQLFAKRRDCPYAAGASLRPSVRPSVARRPPVRPPGCAERGRRRRPGCGSGSGCQDAVAMGTRGGGQRRAGSSGRGSVRAGGTGPPPPPPPRRCSGQRRSVGSGEGEGPASSRCVPCGTGDERRPRGAGGHACGSRTSKCRPPERKFGGGKTAVTRGG